MLLSNLLRSRRKHNILTIVMWGGFDISALDAIDLVLFRLRRAMRRGKISKMHVLARWSMQLLLLLLLVFVICLI